MITRANVILKIIMSPRHWLVWINIDGVCFSVMWTMSSCPLNVSFSIDLLRMDYNNTLQLLIYFLEHTSLLCSKLGNVGNFFDLFYLHSSHLMSIPMIQRLHNEWCHIRCRTTCSMLTVIQLNEDIIPSLVRGFIAISTLSNLIDYFILFLIFSSF